MIQVGIMFGGRSPEHEISIISAKAIATHMDPEQFAPVLFPVDRSGRLYEGAGAFRFLETGDETGVKPVPFDRLKDMNVIFPVFHGPYGEDGSIQGLLAFMGVPYVGCGVESSALNMHKGLFRDLMAVHEIPQPDYVVFPSHRLPDPLDSVLDRLPLPVFVKPSRGGSSIGISRVDRAEDLEAAVREAARYDRHVIVEEAIDITEELEVAVLGTWDQPVVSRPGKLVAGDVFYTYRDKYVDSKTQFEIPVEGLDEDVVNHIRLLAGRAFSLTGCHGLARVDFLFNRETGHVALNEINTMPGFTEISMYPKLMMASGLSFRELVTRLISLADERVDL